MSKFQVVSEYQPAGDQPEAIAALAAGIENGLDEQTLLGVTGSGKTFTMAKVIEAVQRPTLVLAHNKTLAAQLCAEFKEFFPNNAVEYFVSYYDYYQPEAYIPHTDTFIEKDSAVNEEIDRLRDIMANGKGLVASIEAREKEKTGIKSLKDAKGKVVNIGNPGSGNRQNAIDVFEAAGINIEKDLKAESIKAADAPRMLQDGRIDGFFYTVGHPNGNIKEATAGKRKTRIVSITDIEPLVKKFPYYSLTNIDMAQYPEATNANEKVTTVGMLATFVTSAKVPDDVVYAITKEVFENLDEFKKLHPALEGLTRETMLEGLTAPIHPGALKYYKEAGLMK